MEQRPLPDIDACNKPYWDAARASELLLPKCTGCGEFFFPPRRWCPHCFSRSLGWAPAIGLGSIVSFSKLYIASFDGYVPSFPYVVAMVKLAEGTQMMTNIVNCDPDAIQVGARVRVVFEARAGGVKVPQFELV